MLVLGIGFGGFLLARRLLRRWTQGCPRGTWSKWPPAVKTIQHLTGGIVDTIDVKARPGGQKTEVLVKLNPLMPTGHCSRSFWRRSLPTG